jgi:glycosyltransferase involved in cell wall biosynthesis
MKSKVIIVGSAYPLRGGGISTFNERMCKAFIEEGFDCKIFSYKLQYPSLFFPGKSQYTDEPPPKDTPIETLVNSINPINWIKVGQRLSKENPEIVILRYWMPFFGPCLGTIARVLRRRNRNVKIVAITDNIIPHEPNLLDKVLTRYFVNSVSRYVTLSQAVMAELKDYSTTLKVVFTPHPLYDNFGEAVSKDEACSGIGVDPKYTNLLFFGFIRDYKGLDILLEAFEKVLEQNKSVRLMIVGEFYGNKEKYLPIIEKEGLAEYIYLNDNYIENSEVYKYFCASDILVQPYKTASQSGVSQVAYHFNKPMIVTNVGALPEMVPDGRVGFVTNVDSNEVADAILKYIEYSDKDFFIRNIQKEKEKYSWEVFVSNLMSVFKE